MDGEQEVRAGPHRRVLGQGHRVVGPRSVDHGRRPHDQVADPHVTGRGQQPLHDRQPVVPRVTAHVTGRDPGSQVDHRVDTGEQVTQVGDGQVHDPDLDPGCRRNAGPPVQPDHVMAVGGEAGTDPSTDRTGGTGHDDPHGRVRCRQAGLVTVIECLREQRGSTRVPERRP